MRVDQVSRAEENMHVWANGSRARLSRDVGNVTMDINGVERIRLAALGGADTITVNDLTGTDVQQIAINMGGIDGQLDAVLVTGTVGDDRVTVASNGSTVVVNGLAAQV